MSLPCAYEKQVALTTVRTDVLRLQQAHQERDPHKGRQVARNR